jgi:Tfp pilus assembly protein PilF
MHYQRSILTLCTVAVLLCAAPVNAGNAREMLQRADEAWAAGNMHQAEDLFHTAVERHPASVEARMRLAGFYLGNLRYRDSVLVYRAVIGDGSAEPDVQAKAFIGMGVAYLHGGKRRLAHASFQEAIQLDPARKEQLQALLSDLETVE